MVQIRGLKSLLTLFTVSIVIDMQLSGRPLLETSIDQTAYLERTVDDRVRNAISHGLNVLILGVPGSGKTSLLRHLHFDAASGNIQSTYIDGRTVKSVPVLLDTVRAGLGVPAVKPPPFALISTFGESYVPEADAAIDNLRKSIRADNRPVVLLDSPNGEVARLLFGALRDEIWQVPLTWIVAADAAAEADFRRPPVDAFFDVVERLDQMTVADVVRFLQLRGVSVDGAKSIAESVNDMPALKKTPRDVLNLARKVIIDGGDAESEVGPHSAMSKRLESVTSAAALLARELMGQGAVSASDSDLQMRMGWSRARLTQVLKELEDAGIARSSQSSQGKTGRPKRMYEVVDP